MHLTEPTLAGILAPVRAEMDALEVALDDGVTGIGEPLSAVLHRSLKGGKRLRPAVVILVGHLYRVPAEPFIKLGAAAEMIHTATLMHDDLVDGAAYRRGRETRHEIWPASATVLAGDFLLGLAVSMISSLGKPRVLEIMSDAFATMSGGEIQEIFQEKYGREAYYDVIEAKTASFFSGCARAAGVLANAPPPQVKGLGEYGRQLGLAFQIMDDVIDYAPWCGTGKPSGKDLEQGLLTLPAILYLENGGDRSILSAAITSKDTGALEEGLEAIRRSGAWRESLKMAAQHAERARAALGGLPDCEARRTLRSLADYVAGQLEAD